MNIGIFGGTFDPFHNGHLEICKCSIEKGKLDKLIILPAGAPPHKMGETIATAVHRIEIIKIMTKSLDKVELSTYEIDSGKINYTAETLLHFQQLYSSDNLFFIIGDDSYRQFKTWCNYDKILDLCTVLVFPREGAVILPPFVPIDMEIIAISSTDIRTQIQKGKSTKEMISSEAAEYINKHKIYGDLE